MFWIILCRSLMRSGTGATLHLPRVRGGEGKGQTGEGRDARLVPPKTAMRPKLVVRTKSVESRPRVPRCA